MEQILNRGETREIVHQFHHSLAGLLHHRGLVRLDEMRWKELAKAMLAAVIAGAISFEVAKAVPLASTGHGNRVADIMQIALVSITWAAAAAAALWLLRSELPRDLRRSKAAAYPAVAQDESSEILGAGR